MKKLVYISFFMLLLASCQKEGEVVVSTGGTTTEGTDNGDGGVDSGGDITDPMRKKDKKDNK